MSRTYPSADGSITTTWQPRQVRSIANVVSQRHNCPDCRNDDDMRRHCECCHGSGEVRGRCAPVDALLPVQYAGKHHGGTSYACLFVQPGWKARQQRSLRGMSAGFRDLIHREIELDVELNFPKLSPETVAYYRSAA